MIFSLPPLPSLLDVWSTRKGKERHCPLSQACFLSIFVLKNKAVLFCFGKPHQLLLEVLKPDQLQIYLCLSES